MDAHLRVFVLFVCCIPATNLAAQNDGGAPPVTGFVSAWHGESPGSGPADTSLAAVLAEARTHLVLGHPAQALAILARRPDGRTGYLAAGVYAEALYQQGEYAEAGAAYQRAAATASRRDGGVLEARAGEAYQRARDFVRAGAAYRSARERLPELAGWLAYREASVTRDTATALALLVSAPPEAARLVDEARAELYEAAGDTAAAIDALRRIERWSRAGELALLTGDTDRARSSYYRALESRQSVVALSAADVILERFPPATDAELLATGRAVSRNGRPAHGAELLATLIARGDSSAFTLMMYGRMIAAAGDRPGALRVYELASRRPEPEAAEAEMERARLLVTVRQRTLALAALDAFVTKYPSHTLTPSALIQISDLDAQARRFERSDSVLAVLAEVWARHDLASDARIRLASRALSRNDSTAAIRRYRDEIDQRGRQAPLARYQIADISQRQGDWATARREWTVLARTDSVGYYGTTARLAVGLPRPYFPEPVNTPIDLDVRHAFDVLDLLDQSRFDREADALVEHLLDGDAWTTAQRLDIGERLNDAGRSVQGIRLGWRLAAERSLNDPRVMRIVFPWPHRELVRQEAHLHGLDPFLVAGLIRQESAFDADATSRAGARGMMQLMPTTARWLAGRLGLEWSSHLLGVADANIHMGTAHLAALMDQYEGRDVAVIASLAAYNAGGTPVRRWLLYPEANDPYLFAERIPYAETRGYVRTVLRNRELYAALYGQPAVP